MGSLLLNTIIIMPITAFLRFLNQAHPIKKHLLTYLSDKVTTLSFHKGKFLVSPLDKEDCLYFLFSGAVRGFTKIGQKKITTWISVENNLIGRVRPKGSDDDETQEYVEAIEHCKVVKINKEFLEKLYLSHFEINYIGRVIFQNLYAATEERAFICRLPTAEEKYRRFLVVYPGLIDRIPLRYIASFLGFSLETLSRIRTKIANSNNLLNMKTVGEKY